MSTQRLPTMMPGAQPKFHRGGPIGCLILHGFMASPGEVKWLGDYLAKQGHTVYIPRLTAHGIDPAYMKRVRWQDWYADAVDGYHILKQQCDEMFVMGHSMGGLLAMLLNAAYPVSGIVGAAVPYTPPSRLMPFTHLLGSFRRYRYYPNGPVLHQTIVDEQEKRGEPTIGRVHYVYWWVRAIYELYKLMKITRDALPQVTAPLLLLYAENDKTVVYGDHELFARQVNSTVIEQHLLPKGEHILFQDTGRNEAFRIVSDFVGRYGQSKG